MTNKEKISKISKGVIEILFIISFITINTLSTKNHFNGFVWSVLAMLVYTNFVQCARKWNKMMEDNVFFESEKEINSIKYKLLGFVNVQEYADKNIEIQECDISLTKIVGDKAYIGYYKKIN